MGWYTDNETFENKYDFSRTVHSDLVLYAKWEATLVGSAEQSDNAVSVFGIYDLSLELDNYSVKAVVSAPENCARIVRFIYEDSYFAGYREYVNSGYTYASHVVAAGSDFEELSLEIVDYFSLPEYYVVEAVLLNSDGEAICDPYTTIENTARYTVFDEKTVYDFEESDNIVSFDSSSDDNFGVLADDVRVISSDDVIANDSDADGFPDSYVVTNPSESISEGDKVFVYDAEESHIFKVSVILEEGGKIYIAAADPDDEVNGYALEDFYKFLKVDMNIDNDGSNVASTSCVVPTIGLNIFEVSENLNASAGIDFAPIDFDSTHFQAKVNVEGKISINLVIEWDINVFSDSYFRCDLIVTTELNGGITITAKKGTPDGDDKCDIEIVFGKIIVPLGILGLNAFVDVEAEVEWEISGNLVAEFSSTSKNGFMYNTKDGYQKIGEKDNSWSVKCEAKGELKFGPAPKVGVEFLGGVLRAEIDFFAGVVAEITLAGNIGQVGDSIHMCHVCLSGDVKAQFSANAKLSYKVTQSFKDVPIDFELFNITRDLFTMFVSLVNDEHSVYVGMLKIGLGECDNTAYKVNFDAQDDDGYNIDTDITVYAVDGTVIETIKSGDHVYLINGNYTAKMNVQGQQYTRDFYVAESPRDVTIKTSGSLATINGSVADKITGDFINGAVIEIYDGNILINTIHSDENGAFSASVEQGSYNLIAKAEGYIGAGQTVYVRASENKYIEPFKLAEEDNSKIMGGIYGEIRNGLTGEYVSDIEVKIVKGWNDVLDENAEIVESGYTDYNGQYNFGKTTIAGIDFGLDAGNYTVFIAKEGFVSNSFKVTIVGGEDLVFNSTITPLGAENVYHIVLSWGEYPYDLDSHFNGYDQDGYRDHIYFADSIGISGNLDVDDTSSYGPETITILDITEYSGNVMYSVHDYSNRGSDSSTSMSSSDAKVQIYRGGVLVETFYIPTGMTATVWNVFYIDSDNRIHAVTHSITFTIPKVYTVRQSNRVLIKFFILIIH